MKHPIELDDTSYSLDVTNVVISDCVQKVTAINPLEEYLGGLTNNEGEFGQVPPLSIPIGNRHGKKGKHQSGPSWKKTGKKKKNSITKMSTQHEVEPLFTINQGMLTIHSCLSLNLPGGKCWERMKGSFHFFESP